MLNLYMLELTDEIARSCGNFRCVVAARDAQAARAAVGRVAEASADYGDPGLSVIRKIGTTAIYRKPEVLMFNGRLEDE